MPGLATPVYSTLATELAGCPASCGLEAMLFFDAEIQIRKLARARKMGEERHVVPHFIRARCIARQAADRSKFSSFSHNVTVVVLLNPPHSWKEFCLRSLSSYEAAELLLPRGQHHQCLCTGCLGRVPSRRVGPCPQAPGQDPRFRLQLAARG